MILSICNLSIEERKIGYSQSDFDSDDDNDDELELHKSWCL